MVNYCCVVGCGRNSKVHPQISFYKLPKEKDRKVEWLLAAGREDLIDRMTNRVYVSTHKVCSRHFTPMDIANKSRHLKANSSPKLHLPGSYEDVKSDIEEVIHDDIFCNSCQKQVQGFRYKCVSCQDYDLCQKCETLGVHSEHFVLRIPRPLKFKVADSLIKKWRMLFKTEHMTFEKDATWLQDGVVCDSSSDDDIPITRFRDYDSGVDLSEDIKAKIKREVRRVTKLKPEELKKSKKKVANKKKDDKKRSGEATDNERPSKRLKYEEENSGPSFAADNGVTEMVFADVNNLKENIVVELKPETIEFTTMMPVANSEATPQAPSTSLSDIPATPMSQPETSLSTSLATQGFPEASIEATSHPQHVMHVKLSDDLKELMIEVTSNNQKTFYKYPDANN